MTEDDTRTRQQLIEELARARRRIEALEAAEKSRLQVEQALRESDRTTRAILDQAFQFIGLLSPDGTLLRANRSALDFGGLEQSDVVGRLFWETPWWSHSAELRQQLRNGIERAAAGELVRFEAYHPKADGGLSYIDTSLKPVLGDCGEVIYIIAEGRDVTERKRAEEEAHQLALAVMHSGELVNMASLDGQMTFLNQAGREMLGIDPDQVCRTNIMQVIPEHLAALVRDELLPTLMRGQIWKGELQYLNLKTGELKDVHAVTYPVPDPTTNAPLFLANVSMDITELKRAEKERMALHRQVQHVQKLESLGVLAGGIAHDFNNLLTGVLGNVDLAINELPPRSPAAGYLHQTRAASRRAAELCRQMLAYSGRGSFVVEALSINRLVEEMTRMLAVSVSKRATVVYELAPDLPAVEADATQVRQVVMNLITNASDAIGDRDGRITIRTGAMSCTSDFLRGTGADHQLDEGLYVFVQVSDTGCGMTEEVARRMFEPFFTTKFTGRGLGMAAVLGIVRGHRGCIKVHSEPGRGTTVQLLFPASAASPRAEEAQEGDPERWRGTGTVLLVDDEQTVVAVAERMLERMGFQPLVATDGREAVNLYRDRQREVVCVLLDLTMPRMDGQQTYRALRRINPNVRVVVCSGYTEQDVAQLFTGQGVAGFLQKPFEYAEMVDKVRRAIAQG